MTAEMRDLVDALCVAAQESGEAGTGYFAQRRRSVFLAARADLVEAITALEARAPK